MPELTIRTVQEEGWGGFQNGQLLIRASGGFDVLLTVDQRLRHQQNVKQFQIGVVIIETFDTTIDNLRRLLPEIQEAIEEVEPGAIIIVKERLGSS